MKPTLGKESKQIVSLAPSLLVKWYSLNKRPLPWRLNQDPYSIWISEIMLQQTTVQAVIPYFQRFMEKFVDVHKLADAEIEDIYELWAGLGYYSRARNLHKAAQKFSQTGFPKTYLQLIEYPGLGPYTSRAVSSIAFEERTGVIDGNVIRVLSRLFALKKEWWKPKVREEFQEIADQLVQKEKPSIINQALMELGATICTPKNPTCLLCPLVKNCLARQKDLIEKLPLSKPRRKFEIWIWKPDIYIKNNKIGLIQNNYAPFLKKQMIPPGVVLYSKNKPKKYKAQHTITHHQIFIQPLIKKTNASLKKLNWVELKNIDRVNPSILIKKALIK